MAVAAPQTGLTSCQIGDMGHPGTVHGNPRHIPCSNELLAKSVNLFLYTVSSHTGYKPQQRYTQQFLRPSLLPYLSNIKDVWMVLRRSEEEFDSLCQLDTAEGGVGQVEEDTQYYRDGDDPQEYVGQRCQY